MIFTCGKGGAVDPRDLSPEDAHTLQDFAAMLGGGSGCMRCMMPTAECEALEEKCCPGCKHGVLSRKGPRA